MLDRLRAIEEGDRNQILKEDHLKVVSLKKRTREQVTPTYREVHESIELLKEAIPHRDVNRVISMLYKNLIEKNLDQDGRLTVQADHDHLLTDFIDRKAEFKRNSLHQYDQNMRAINEEKKNPLIRKSYEVDTNLMKRYANSNEQLKFKQRWIVAKAFCNRDYGLSYLEEEMIESKCRMSIERVRYKTIACTIATQTYRKLQKFIMIDCQRGIKPLNRQEMRSIFTLMLNCRKNFEVEECATLFKFISAVYGIAPVTIAQEEAIKLYIVIQKALRTRIGQMQLDRVYDTINCNKQFKSKRTYQHEKFKLHKIWNNHMEIQLLEMYKRTQQLVRIRQHFKQRYPENQHLFTIDSLRSRLHKILRLALRKVGGLSDKHGPDKLTPLIKMTDMKIKYILRSPDALAVRLLLVDIYMRDNCEIKKLSEVIVAINNFINMKENERLNQEVQIEPAVGSLSEKSISQTLQGLKKSRDNRHQIDLDLNQQYKNKNQSQIINKTSNSDKILGLSRQQFYKEFMNLKNQKWNNQNIQGRKIINMGKKSTK